MTARGRSGGRRTGRRSRPARRNPSAPAGRRRRRDGRLRCERIALWLLLGSGGGLLCCQPCSLRGDPAPLLGVAVAGASTVTAGPPRVAIFVVAPMRFGAGGTIAGSGTTGAAAVATDGAACS